MGAHEEAGDDSEDATTSEADGATASSTHQAAHLHVAEASIAVDLVHSVPPVQLMHALQANSKALQTHATAVLRNEEKPTAQDNDGALRPAADAGGREHVRSVILDVQATARRLDDRAKANAERALVNADARLYVCSSALAIPTRGPLDSFNARSDPACYVEWWLGDGAPGLDRERPMLLE